MGPAEGSVAISELIFAE
jgi:hypothetical protein